MTATRRRKRWLALGTFLVTAGVGALLTILLATDRAAVTHYRGLPLDTILHVFILLAVYTPLLLWVGAWGYRALRERWPMLHTKRGTVLYFVVLTVAAFPLQFGRLAFGATERRMEASICAKSRTDGLFTHSFGLTAAEYGYLRTLRPVLPALPGGADSVRVHYYSDGFLPDFGVHVICAVHPSAAADYSPFVERAQDGPTGWGRDTTRTHPRVAWLVYADGES